MINPSKKPRIIAIDDDGVYTAFLSHLPGLVVQGKSKDDVAQKLVKLLDNFIKRLQDSRDNLEIETTTIR